MVAVAHLQQAPHRGLVVVRSTPGQRLAPAPVTAATYRRRRVTALAATGLVLVALLLAVRSLLGGSGGGRLSVQELAGVPGAVHVVQPGDTFWNLARSLRPDDDPRPLVARLVAAHGSPVLVVGERIHLPDTG